MLLAGWWFDKPVLNAAEGLTTNGKKPFGLSLSKANGASPTKVP
jgi:hypothetical protein